MSKKNSGLLFVLQVQVNDDDYAFNASALLDGIEVGQGDNLSVDSVNEWIETISAGHAAVSCDTWVLLPNGSCSYYEIELTKFTKKYAQSTISNYIEPKISTELEATKIAYELIGMTAKTVVMSNEAFSGIQQCIGQLNTIVSKLIAPQSLVMNSEYIKDGIVLFNGYAYTMEDDQLIGLLPEIIASIDREKTLVAKRPTLAVLTADIDSNSLLPNLKSNAKSKSSSNFAAGWFLMSLIGMLIVTGATAFGNIDREQQASGAKKEVQRMYSSIFQNEPIVHLPRQIKAKINATKSDENDFSLTNALLKIEDALSDAGHGNKLLSLKMIAGNMHISWQSNSHESLRMVEDRLRKSSLSATLNSWNKQAGGEVVGEFNIKVSP